MEFARKHNSGQSSIFGQLSQDIEPAKGDLTANQMEMLHRERKACNKNKD